MSDKRKNAFTHQMLHHSRYSEAKKQNQAVGNGDNSDPVQEKQIAVIMTTADCHDS